MADKRDVSRLSAIIESVCEEQWRSVAGFEGYYEVSDHGRVRSLHRGTRSKQRGFLSPRNNKLGYARVHLCRPAYRRETTIGALVLTAFKCNRPKGMQACHNDGDKKNNRLGNLRWDTPAGNAADKNIHGTHQDHRGESHPKAKLTWEKVRKIRDLAAQGYSRMRLATENGISPQNISSIVHGRIWKEPLDSGVDFA